MNNQQGTGLVEIMIGLLLSSLIMTALMNHYLVTKRQYAHLQMALDEAMALQLASDVMRDSIRQAGFTPCLNIDQLTTLDHRDNHENLMALDVSSGLQINRMSPYFDVVNDIVNSTQLLVTPDKTILTTRPLLIADCYHAEVHRVSAINQTSRGQFITLQNPLTFTYQPPVYVGEWLQERFFVQSPGGLYYHRHHTDELTTLVKTMFVTIQKKIINTLVQVKLGLDDGRTLTLDTKVRAR